MRSYENICTFANKSLAIIKNKPIFASELL